MFRLVTCAVIAGLSCAEVACRKGQESKHPEFWQRPVKEQDAALLEYPPEEQVEIYLYGVEMWHPPRFDLAYPLASSGEAVLPLLLEHLKRAETASRKEKLLYALEAMSCHHQNLSGNAAVIRAAEEAVESMEPGFWRETSEEHLANLGRPPGVQCEFRELENRGPVDSAGERPPGQGS